MSIDLRTAIQGPKVAQELGPKLEKLKASSREIEAMFLKDLLGAMRRAIPKSDLVEATAGREVYEDLYDQALADGASKGGLLGIGDLLYKQFSHRLLKETQARLQIEARRISDPAAPTQGIQP